jgi:hypothetical protein
MVGGEERLRKRRRGGKMTGGISGGESGAGKAGGEEWEWGRNGGRGEW